MRLPAQLLFIALGLVASAAAAQSNDWSTLTRLKPGATIVVYTPTPADDARCILLRVDASALTCWAADAPATRFVYPAAQIDEVYQVKRPRHTFGVILLLAITGTLIGGFASGNPAAIGVGVLGLIIGCIATLPPPPFTPWGIYAPPQRPNPPAERMVLIYRRAATP